MENLATTIWLVLVVVGVLGWKAMSNQRERQREPATGGVPEQRIQHVEETIATLQTELSDSVKEIDERLMRIETLLREVE